MADKSKLVDALLNYVEMPGRQLNAFFGAKPKASPLAAAKALKQMGGDVLGSIQSAYTAPSRALSGQLRPQLMMDENGNLIQDETNMAKEAGNFAMNVAGGGLGSTIAKPVQGGSNVLGTFVGRRGMDNLGLQDVLLEAEKLKSQKVPDYEIWNRTAQMAAEKGVPGGGITFQFGNKPQFELSDDLAKVNPMTKADFNYAPLESIYEHPTLYKAEPSLKGLAITPTDTDYSFYRDRQGLVGIGNPHRTSSGYNDELGNYIEQYNFQPDVIGHEVNHALEFKHGLPNGGNQLTQKYLNELFDLEKDKYAPNFQKVNQMQPSLNNLYKLDRIRDFDRTLNKRSYVPSDLYRRGDWYEHSDAIRSALGVMPKRPGIERNEYIKNAHQILFDKYKEKAGVTQDDIDYALSKTPGQIKYGINKIWKQLEPDYQAIRDFNELKNKNYEMNQLNPFQVYDRLTGEATSRLVQDRWNMTPAERAANYPVPKLSDSTKQINPWELIDIYYD